MATETSVRTVDDLDGTEASATVKYTWQGQDYEIDLSEGNAAAFADVLAPYLAASRRPNAPRRGRRTQAAAVSTADVAAIRGWAADNGHQVSARGRIAGSVLAAYHAAQQRITDDDEPAEQSGSAAAPSRRGTRTAAGTTRTQKAPVKKSSPRAARKKTGTS